MAKAIQPEVTAGSIFFELDRFEPSNGDRLELSGRWFGVRGRRFMRPNLALTADTGQFRALADLEHKPWSAEDGESWEAAFPWNAEGELLEIELTVAPDITVRLPAPSARRRSPKRLTALPRNDISTTRRRKPQKAQDGHAEPPPVAESEPAPRAAEVPAATSELDALRAELAESRQEVARLSGELEALRGELDGVRGDGEQLGSERDSARSERDRALADRDQTRSDRDQALAERDQLLVELQQTQEALEQAARARQQVIAARERVVAERDEALTQRDQVRAERDHAIDSRGAALVMRNATRASPTATHDAAWLQRALAIVVLVGVVCALLIVLHVL